MSVSDVGVVILNYRNADDTLNCIKRVVAQKPRVKSIVVVDNGSHDESVQRIQSEYGTNPQVHLISSEKNLGFAKGNNLGIQYLKQHKIFRIFVMNPDMILDDPNFLEKITNCGYDNNVAMIGPRIQDEAGYDMNPRPVVILQHGKLYTLVELLYEYAKSAYYWLKDKINLNKSGKYLAHQSDICVFPFSVETILDPQEYLLHGSGIYFTEHFLSRFDGFFPDTFLYQEEDALNLLCQRTPLRQMYLGSVIAIHKGSTTTQKIWGADFQRTFLHNLRESRIKVIKLSLLNNKHFLDRFRKK